jgi:P-type Cu+ transporter
MTKDPVCGMRIVKHQAAGTSNYKGEDYFFCSTACKQKFDKQPAQFINQDQAAKQAGAGSNR